MSIACEQPLIFQCALQQRVGVLHHAEGGARRPGVLIVVGGPQYRVGSHRQFILMARSLARAGYPVMRFDCRGMGDSPGEMQTFEQAAEDIRAAIETFSSSLPGLPGIVLWGLCDGASAALMHGVSDARVRGLILANPWVRTTSGEAKAYVQQYYGRRFLQRSFWQKLISGRLDVVKALRDLVATIHASRETVKSRHEGGTEHFIQRMLRGMQQFSGPTLILISERDLTAAEFTSLCRDDPVWSRAIARTGVHVITLATADHTFSNRDSLEAAITHCTDWLNEFMPSDIASQTASRG